MIKDGITLWSCSDINHDLLKFALEKTSENVPHKEVIIFSDREIKTKVPNKFVKLNKKIGVFDYSTICVELNSHIQTSHVLIFQYDGMAVKGNYWKNEYLQYDYIGSPLHTNHMQVENYVDFLKTNDVHLENWQKNKWLGAGGGGFSLRSKKLLEILENDPIIKEQVKNECISPEDMFICVRHRNYLIEKYNIKFAPIDVCLDFCTETLFGYRECLGFHGWYNVPTFLTENECLFYLMNLQKENYGNFHNVEMVKLISLVCEKNYTNVLKYIEERFQFSHNLRKFAYNKDVL